MSTVIDYLGRTSDLLVFRGTTPGKEVLLQQAVATATDSGSLITGIQKLVQFFLLALLKKRRSMTYVDDGCNFMLDADYGGWRTVGDVQQSFNAALLDVQRQLQANELPEDPSDERYGSAELLQVIFKTDRVGLYIRLSSLSGTSVTFIAPLPVMTR